MADTGEIYAGTATDELDFDTSTYYWRDTTNATGNNNSTCAYTNNPLTGASGADESNYLRLNNYGFAIPSTATVVGVEVELSRSDDRNNGAIYDKIIQLANGATLIGDNKADIVSSIDFNVSNGVSKTYGSSTDDWNASLTPTIVNSSDFGIKIKYSATGDGRPQVFFCGITIYYSTYTYTLDLAENLGVSTNELANLDKEIDDIVKIAENIALAKGIPFSTSDSFTLGEVIGFIRTYRKDIYDIVKMTEVFQIKSLWNKKIKPTTTWGTQTKPSSIWTKDTKPTTNWT